MTTEVMPETVPAETVTPLKPSEAMRMGCLIEPRQAFEHEVDMFTGAVCAFGAMRLGYGVPLRTAYAVAEKMHAYRFDDRDNTPAFKACEQVLDADQTSTCPAQPCESDWMEGLTAVVVHLNDDHFWPRERIADYLGKISY